MGIRQAFVGLVTLGIVTMMTSCGVTAAPLSGIAISRDVSGRIVAHFALCPDELVQRVIVGIDTGDSTDPEWLIVGSGTAIGDVVVGSDPVGFDVRVDHPEVGWPGDIELVAESTSSRGDMGGVAFRFSDLPSGGRVNDNHSVAQWRESVLASPGFCS